MLFFRLNDKALRNTPKRETFKTGEEEVSDLEEILFGRKILNFTFLEALYIINEKKIF